MSDTARLLAADLRLRSQRTPAELADILTRGADALPEDKAELAEFLRDTVAHLTPESETP